MMDYLHKLVSKLIANSLKPDEILLRLVERELEARGIILTDGQKANVKANLLTENKSEFRLTLTEDQEEGFLYSGGLKDTKLVINLDDNERIEPLDAEIEKLTGKIVQETITLFSSSLLDAWKSQSPDVLNQQKKDREGFARQIRKIWGKPLELLEMLLSISLQFGATFNDYYRTVASKENDLVFEAITRLHARGCQVGSEALILLKNGFADGAHARWRTLHEICVEALFIFQNGKDVAEQFLFHAEIYNYKLAKEYQKYHDVLGYAAPDQSEIEMVEKRKDDLLNQYGDHFYYDYGWAAQVLNNRRPTFVDLEKFVGLEHIRPFYKLANINVHSGSKGADYRLGSSLERDVLVAGPSIYGIGEPGQNIAFSFHTLTSTLLLSRENLDRLAYISALSQLKDEIFWAFDEVMEHQEEKSS